MAGSSLRNAVHRRNHKERSQPVGRAKLGLLEKHKDYVLRAKDHHKKRDMLKRLSEKAAMRNKDEFYFGMINSSTRNGVHQHARPSEQLDNDVVALLKTQDVGYVRAQIVAEKKRVKGLVERLAPSVAGLSVEWLEEKAGRRETLERAGLIAKAGGKGKKAGSSLSLKKGSVIGAQGKKTVWLDDADAIRSYSSSSSSTSTSKPAPAPAPATKQIENDDNDDDEFGENWIDDLPSDSSDIEDSLIPTTTSSPSSSLKKGNKHLGYLTTELASRYARLDALQLAAEKLNLVRALMTHKGGRSQVVKAKKNALEDAVMQGKVTSNGLALPGNEESDDEDEQGKPKKKVYKFSKQRKR
ncbi:related to UTP11 - subunit of U3-containing small subunit processome complex [Ustilago trichophora]|uniref:Related to UTP11 - subunit of U3-containing small subunit processome complex n=1 Tax=Ustilago trichophora TaxID=86804 RepID=A0A5C3DS69_9BASI|nr:related to UTP11 - subunit of U3-containing small subunit processome complex [Ustilago trichophora]